VRGVYVMQEELEDTKEVIRNRKSTTDRQYNGHKKKTKGTNLLQAMETL